MMKRLMLGLVLGLIFLCAGWRTLAQDSKVDNDRVIFGDNLTLKPGDTVAGDVVIFGGRLVMAKGSHIEGDVAIFGGQVNIAGLIEGSVAGIGSSISLAETAEVEGDVAGLGSRLSIDSEAQIEGTITDGLNPYGEAARLSNPISNEADGQAAFGFFHRISRFFGDGVQDIVTALIVAGLCTLIALLFPSQMQGVQETLQTSSSVSFLVGLITLAAAFFVNLIFILLCWLLLPICGIFLISFALIAAFFMGWTVVGRMAGERIFHHFENPTPNAVSSTLLGVTVISLVSTMPFLNELPLIGWGFGLAGFLSFFLLSSCGLGAVFLSRFGTHVYRHKLMDKPPVLPLSNQNQ